MLDTTGCGVYRYLAIKWAIDDAISRAGGLDAVQDKIGDKTPRDDQVKMAKDIINRMAGADPVPDDDIITPRGIICELPTGGGKTVVAMMVFRWLRDHVPGMKLAFAVARNDIVAQTAHEFHKHGFKVKIECDKVKSGLRRLGVTERVDDEEADITVASLQTWTSRANPHKKRKDPPVRLWDGLDIVCIDEAHWDYANEPLDTLLGNAIVFGLSATPLRHQMRKRWNPTKVLGCSQEYLERIGVLAPLLLHTTDPDPDEKEQWDHATKYHEPDADGFGANRLSAKETEERDRASETLLRMSVKNLDKTIAEIESRTDYIGVGSRSRLRTLIKASSISAAEQLADAFNTAEKNRADNDEEYRPHYMIAAHSGNADVTGEDVKTAFSKVGGKRGVVICHQFTTGFDHPGIEMIILTGKMSLISFIQTLGRGLRTGADQLKRVLIVADMAGNIAEHHAAYTKRWLSPAKKLPLPPDPTADANEESGKGDDRPDEGDEAVDRVKYSLYVIDGGKKRNLLSADGTLATKRAAPVSGTRDDGINTGAITITINGNDYVMRVSHVVAACVWYIVSIAFQRLYEKGYDNECDGDHDKMLTMVRKLYKGITKRSLSVNVDTAALQSWVKQVPEMAVIMDGKFTDCDSDVEGQMNLLIPIFDLYTNQPTWRRK